MNAQFPPVRIISPFEQVDAFDDDGMPSMAERLARSARNMAMLDAMPPLPEPSAEQVAQARKAADDAVGSLIADLAKGQRKYNREFGK
jgi:hypothetical protein